ncbi:MAG: ClpX C4-type zinc finger protein [Chloroflexota bacterium]
MWVVTAHGPDGVVVEAFETEAEAKAAQQTYLDQRMPVLLDPTGKGLPLPRTCSFCGKTREQVGNMCAGPAGAGVVICDECVVLVSAIFAERPAAPVD